MRCSLVCWQQQFEEADYTRRCNLNEEDFQDSVHTLNLMFREIYGVHELINLIDAADLAFRYPRLWTWDRMRRESMSTVLYLGILGDFKDPCLLQDWLFGNRPPFWRTKLIRSLVHTIFEVPPVD